MSLTELILAIMIFGLIIMSMMGIYHSSEDIVTESSIYFDALVRGEESLEKYSQELVRNYYTNIATTTSLGFFTETVNTQEIGNFTKRLKVKYSWFFNKHEHVLENQRLVTNYEEAIGSGDCQLSAAESWQSPGIYSGLDLGYGNQATAIASLGKVIYLTANNIDPRNIKADPSDLFIIDAKNSSNLELLSKIDSGPGLSAIALTSHFAYLGNTSINAQLQIADISNGSKPKIIANYKIPGNYNDQTTISSSIFFHRGSIYLGTAKSQIEELHIIDVSIPDAPKEVGKWENDAAINRIYSFSHFLFLATPKAEELALIDIATSTAPRLVSNFDAPGGSGNGKSLSRDRNTLFLGRTVGKDELYILSLSNIPQLTLLSTIMVGDSINDLLAVPDRLFVLTNHSFMVFDTVDPKHLKKVFSHLLGAKGTGISCSGKNIYLSLSAQNGLLIIQPN